MAASVAPVVQKLTVRADRIVVDLLCDPASPSTTPDLAARARALRPNLARHACINEKGQTFGAVMDRTPIPHLFEHLVIDVLVETSGEESDVFVGTSEWVDRAAGTARVEVSFVDDLEALAAIKQALCLFKRIMGESRTAS